MKKKIDSRLFAFSRAFCYGAFFVFTGNSGFCSNFVQL